MARVERIINWYSDIANVGKEGEVRIKTRQLLLYHVISIDLHKLQTTCYIHIYIYVLYIYKWIRFEVPMLRYDGMVFNRGAFLAALGSDWSVDIKRVRSMGTCCCGGQGCLAAR